LDGSHEDDESVAAGLGDGCGGDDGRVCVVAQAHPQATQQFRDWLTRDCGWTQRQRLARIQRDWLSYLLMLSDQERYDAAVAITAAINSPGLEDEREQLIEQVLGAGPVLASR
jgi:hypothetical protein